MAYDAKCYELAEHFLDDSASVRQVSELAQHIQDSIEAWIEGPEDGGSWEEYKHIKDRKP